MSKVNLLRRCYNCGAILQSEDAAKPGYIAKEKLENAVGVLFCDKCWNQQKYNFGAGELTVSRDYLEVVKDARASDALIVYVVDIFSFETSFVKEVTDLLQGMNILVIAAKRDLLPAKANDEELREYVAHRFRAAALRVKAEDVLLASSLDSYSDVTPLAKVIDERRKGHDVYFIGASTAGKTSFLSSFLRTYKNRSRRAIATVNYPGTKLHVMTIPLDNSSSFYDTPGTSLENSIRGKLDFENLDLVIPHETISKRVHTLSENESVFIGGLARIDLLSGPKTELAGYFAKTVSYKKVVKNGGDAFFKQLGRGSLAPFSASKVLADFDCFDISVDELGQRDIGIEGLGWVSFAGADQTFRLYVPKGVSIYYTRAKIK